MVPSKVMDKQSIVGFVGTAAMMEEFFIRVIEAEKKMGPLSREERVIILKSLAEPVTLEELCDMMQGKRTLIVKNDEKRTER